MSSDDPKVIMLTPVGKTPDERLNNLSDSVYQLAVAHMVNGLKLAQRLRSERGHVPLDGQDILALLGVKDHAWIALECLTNAIDVHEYAGAEEVITALTQADSALGRPLRMRVPATLEQLQALARARGDGSNL